MEVEAQLGSGIEPQWAPSDGWVEVGGRRCWPAEGYNRRLEWLLGPHLRLGTPKGLPRLDGRLGGRRLRRNPNLSYAAKSDPEGLRFSSCSWVHWVQSGLPPRGKVRPSLM